MDFRRISLPPFAVPGDILPERFLGAPAERAFFPRPLNRSRRIAMNTQIDQSAEVARHTTLGNSQLHATLREVPLPVGFMRRMRQFVEQELELSE
jgi:hypothetical protein